MVDRDLMRHSSRQRPRLLPVSAVVIIVGVASAAASDLLVSGLHETAAVHLPAGYPHLRRRLLLHSSAIVALPTEPAVAKYVRPMTTDIPSLEKSEEAQVADERGLTVVRSDKGRKLYTYVLPTPPGTSSLWAPYSKTEETTQESRYRGNFGEAVRVRNRVEPIELPSYVNCQRVDAEKTLAQIRRLNFTDGTGMIVDRIGSGFTDLEWTSVEQIQGGLSYYRAHSFARVFSLRRRNDQVEVGPDGWSKLKECSKASQVLDRVPNTYTSFTGTLEDCQELCKKEHGNVCKGVELSPTRQECRTFNYKFQAMRDATCKQQVLIRQPTEDVMLRLQVPERQYKNLSYMWPIMSDSFAIY